MEKIVARPHVMSNLSNLIHDEKLWNKILKYDLSVVTKTFAERNPEHATIAWALEIECKRLIYLAAIAPNFDLAPTKPIDDYWHQFILFTPQYEAFCLAFVGHFVHHNPLAGVNHDTIFERTQCMITKLFGKFENVGLWFLSMPATSSLPRKQVMG